MEQDLKPHKYAECIHAFADGHKIEEKKFIDHRNFSWVLNDSPSWDKETEYRIYDPYREIKEAFKRGEIIQFQSEYCDIGWHDYDQGSEPSWESVYYTKWRIKPKEDFKIGEWVIVKNQNIVTRVASFSKYGYVVSCDNKVCYPKEAVRIATKQEVLEAPNYDGSATNEDFLFEPGDYIKDIKLDKVSILNYLVYDHMLQDFICSVKSDIGNITTLSTFLRYATQEDIEKYLREKQTEYMETVQDCGLNVVACGNCGTVFTHEVGVETVVCPGCLEEMDLTDCPDLW